MPSKPYPHPEERPKARLEGRKTVMQPFVPILAQPLRFSTLLLLCDPGLDQWCAFFETAAARLPQNEEFR